jgi:hypothetical protein
MADQNQNKIFGDIDVPPEQQDGLDSDRRRREQDAEDLRVNDEDVDSGQGRSNGCDRPSTAGDMANPRTGPIG